MISASGPTWPTSGLAITRALVPNQSQSGNYTSEAGLVRLFDRQRKQLGSGNEPFRPDHPKRLALFCQLHPVLARPVGLSNQYAGKPVHYKGIDGVRGLISARSCRRSAAGNTIISKVRSRKWDFVFMTESLDGGAVTYRSNRHFDILNENLIFDLQSASSANDYRTAFDSRRNSYGQGLVLLNNVSHDEESYSDPYETLVRYMACSTIDGAPMIFYGEELGISTDFGFDAYQLNFGKNIPNFMVYNDLQPIFNPANRNYGLDQLWPVYAAVNQARQFSPALKSLTGIISTKLGSETPQSDIFLGHKKYQMANAAPNFSDVVFAFTPLDRNNTQAGNFDVNVTQNGSNLFGIQSNRLYNVRNISAYTAIDPNRRNYWLWNNGSGGIAGSNILANGIFVSLNPVPTSNAGWSSAPFGPQYLKLYDVTPPPTPSAPGTSATNNYVLTNVVTFNWAAVIDTQGGISGYYVTIGTHSRRLGRL